MLERDVACSVTPDKGFVNDFRTAAGWETKNKRLAFGWFEGFDSTLMVALEIEPF